MRGLRKYLTPFAPDQSGAVSVLYELGGIIVICDAGGCAGNVCGFDEPRWFEQKSAVFSAGLRDMDAILGRDDRLVAKLVDAAVKVEAGFAAIIGTPVPAVIGTDHQALRRMCEKKTDLPVLAVNTNGMELYDAGERKAYLELFKAFAREKLPVEAGKTGILGMTPQDVSDLKAADKICEKFRARGQRAVCYGMGDGLDEVKKPPLRKKISWFLLRHWNVPDIWRKPSEHLMRWDILWRKSWFLIWIIQEKDSHRAAAGDGRFHKRGATETWCGRRAHRGKLVFHGKKSPGGGRCVIKG